ncbi:FG-GAP repeat domain-containing protein [Streptomyces violascens]|uniref:VCBS repeat-containing protein n=1 Tax=Streptomyces violascens TaxID=67381 RepID=A0ABQ3R2H0_9ACTN|nr:VCBS repeat-containing protein [Streptomyces violascens]GHI43724.1 hypothetical protein Sviol_81320 [Streptomyces violascens]
MATSHPPSAPGWPTTSRYVPAGDLTNDGNNDLLVRDASGQLTRYDGATNKPFAPSGPHLALGAGWNAYDQLTVPGDLTGDTRPDLLARTPSGDLYMYADNGAGQFKDPVKIGFGWGIYNTVVGAGDLNGDGFGDLLARDTSGVLWRYDGNGRGNLRRPGPPGRGLGHLQRARRSRRHHRRRQGGPRGPRHRRRPVALPRKRRGRLHRPRCGSAPAGRRI